MNRRPKPGEDEEDLLAYQDEFLSSGSSPSAKLIRPGGKRTSEGRSQTAGRDVVHLDAGTVRPISVGAPSNKPPTKKSKFKQQRSRTAQRSSPQEGYPGSENVGDVMDRQDRHITKILSEVRERDTVTPIQMVPSSYARLGFPSIKEVNLQQKEELEEGKSDQQTGSKGNGKKKKKSLFAQQFGEMPLSTFDIVDKREGESPGVGMESKDKLPEHSPASHAKQLLDAPSIVSGEGLKGMGMSDDQVSTDLRRMHEENVRTLSAMPEEEIQREKETVMQSLSPNLVAFLKRRRKGDEKEAVEKESAMEEGKSQGGGKPEETPRDTLPPEVTDIEGSWLHMDVTEAEKLEWMADTPVGQQNEGKREARFSFDGLLLPKSMDLPTTLGLHHHGDDPESAGYTLQELLHLSRSSVLQQRVLSIATLAKIIERDHRNEFAGILDHSPIHSLVDAGFPLLLRYALDESSLGMVSAAVQATHNLLVVGNEEVILDSLSLCCSGAVLPSLEAAKDHREEEEAKDDDAVLREDVIKGLLQVKLLPRLRYILEVMTPPPPVVDMILRILTRISRHSLQAASEVYNCPRLMDTVQVLYLDGSEPHPAAVKLMIAVARAGRNLAAQLVHKYKVMNTVIKSVAILPMSCSAQELYVWSCCLWRVLLSYGLGAEHLRDAYSTILGHLVSSMARLSDLTAEEVHCVCALLCVLEGGLHVAAIKAEDVVIEDSKDVLQAPALDWSFARGVLQPVVTFVNTVTQQLSSTPHESQTLLLSHLLNILSSYAMHLPDMLLHTQSMVHVLEQFDEWFGPTGCVTTVVESGVLLKALGALSQLPLLSTTAQAGLPSLPRYELPPVPAKLGVYGQTVMEQSDWRELLQGRTERLFAADLATSAFGLLDTVTNTHKGLLNKVSPLLMDAAVLSYLKLFHCQQLKRHQSGFSTAETSTAVHLVQMFTSLLILHPGTVPVEVITVYHQACLGLLSLLPAGSEVQLLQLLERSVLLPAMFWELGGGGDVRMSERDLDLLTLHESPQMVTGEQDKTTRELLSEALGCLPQIQTEIIAAVKRSCLLSKALQRARDRQNHKVLRIETLLLPSNCGSLLPSDWPMLPLLHHYNAAVEGSGHIHSDAVAASPKTAAAVLHSLLLWLLLEHLRPMAMEGCTVPAKFARLTCVFLTSSDLFLDSTIHSCVAALLRMLTAPKNLSKLDFAAQIPGVSSFYDLYMALVSQFSAVSYGDALFASFVLLPLQQCSPGELRRLVWDEQSHVLRALSLPIEQLPVPLNNFLYPVERDESILSLYRRALHSGAVKPTWSPVMYRIATHHLQNMDNM